MHIISVTFEHCQEIALKIIATSFFLQIKQPSSLIAIGKPTLWVHHESLVWIVYIVGGGVLPPAYAYTCRPYLSKHTNQSTIRLSYIMKIWFWTELLKKFPILATMFLDLLWCRLLLLNICKFWDRILSSCEDTGRFFFLIFLLFLAHDPRPIIMWFFFFSLVPTHLRSSNSIIKIKIV